MSNKNYHALLQAYRDWLDTLGYSPSLCKDYPRFVSYFLCWLEEQCISDIRKPQPTARPESTSPTSKPVPIRASLARASLATTSITTLWPWTS